MGYEEKTQALQRRADQVLAGGMELVDLFVNKNYLIDLSRCEPVPLPMAQRSFSYLTLFEITKIVYDKNEDINDKLVSVYSALSNFGSTALLLIFSEPDGVRFCLGTRDGRQPTVAKAILEKSLRGNFPGIELTEQSGSQMAALLERKLPDTYAGMAISSVSIVPSPRDEDKTRFVQGLEKFIDSMAGETYTAVFVSSPLGKAELESKKRGYEELYTALSQCAQVNLTYGENDSEAIARGVSETFTRTVNEGISDTTGTTESTGSSETSGTSDTRSRNRGSNFGFFGMGHNFGSGRTSGSTYSQGSTWSQGTSSTRSETRGTADATARGTSDTTTATTGSTTTMAITRQNKTVQNLLERIDQQLERIKNCESYGLWDTACYFIAPAQETAIVAANTFKALVAGEKTAVENSFINLWDNGYESADKSLVLLDYLRYGLHPRFTYLPPAGSPGYSPQTVTPASLISGLELPVLMGLPRKSVSGLTSISSAEFGRNVFVREKKPGGRNVDIGAVYHMGEVFPKNRVRLDLQSLTAHCFITGSTGSGKSNTTYKIIEELIATKNRVNFLVIEPAKGEYKLAFGGLPGVRVFTTNPKYFEMLCINPFSFPPEIHVLEHLDRLIEIFSACWPLYAAMPALLKASFEQAYIQHGWDLNHSIHIDMGNGMYPDFRDIVRILPEMMEKSEFSGDTKGDYVGALVTRVESLTNGLLGQVFSGVAVDDETLFDGNTIVDLSRVGSAETKALMMGLLVLKLSEYRQSTATGTNCPLKHVTILEEAHNLLKRTSTEQGQESANVQGKSVEMISNSIAEMRTYGEGFIIVDQSPTAVDISAIKNTNTKIIMRLPEKADCEAVGHSIGLNEDQILELSRLDKGVAAIYQNSWLEAVLTKIDKAEEKYELKTPVTHDRKNRVALAGELVTELMDQLDAGEFNLSWLLPIVNGARVSADYRQSVRTLLMTYGKAHKTPNRAKAFNELIFRLLNCGDLLRIFEGKLPPDVQTKDDVTDAVRETCRAWKQDICKNLCHYGVFPDQKILERAFHCVLLHKIEMERHDRRYKIVLYCL